MRFDGYYVLADWLEVPNLRTRARQQMLGSVLNWFNKEANPVNLPARGWEGFVLVLYGAASYLYIWFIVLRLFRLLGDRLEPYGLSAIGRTSIVLTYVLGIGIPLVAVGKRLAPALRVITIPGITSYHAAAALTHTPLSEGEESFLVVSGALGAAKLRAVIDTTENIVLLKTYRHADEILSTLEELGLTDRAVCISRVGLQDETVVQDVRTLKGRPLPYLSMIIIKKKGENFGGPGGRRSRPGTFGG